MSTVQRPDDKRARRGRPARRRTAARDEPVMGRDERLIWLGIALVAGVDGGIVAGLLTAVAGGTKQVALGAGGVAALGTFGAVLTVVRFLHNSPEK